MQKLSFTAPAKASGAPPTLAAMLRAAAKLTWSRAQQLCERGKVSVDGEIVEDGAHRVRPGAQIEIDERRPAPKPSTVPIVFEDAHVVVIDKPAGISSVPYEKREGDTAMDAIRDAWRAEGRRATETPLFVVHRIDKDTSGLLAFAKTKHAERLVQGLFRKHDVERSYLCVVHGAVGDLRIETRFVDDRGDGLRGSTRVPKKGKRAVTHVRAIEKLPDTTLLEVRLETGKTHQIRIHLAELGHPLVGERVYVRDYLRKVGEPIPSPRLLLHAATLGFVHPVTGEKISLRSEPPRAFATGLALLRRRPVPPAVAPQPRASRPAPREAARSDEPQAPKPPVRAKLPPRDGKFAPFVKPARASKKRATPTRTGASDSRGPRAAGPRSPRAR